MLKEIHVPPSLIDGIVNLVFLTVAVGATEHLSSPKVQLYVEPPFFFIKITLLNKPFFGQLESQLHQFNILHLLR
jgi:hypothetical protein